MSTNTINLDTLYEKLQSSETMPVMFVGHGSPMNAIDGSKWARGWEVVGKFLPRPKAILSISAHWLTSGETLVDIQEYPPTIHDFGAFPQQLFDVEYPAPGAPEIAKEIISILSDENCRGVEDWGLDHGTWSVLKLLYPKADVPVFQMSIDYNLSFAEQMEIGKKLKDLRKKGVLILGSGDFVHNLREMLVDGSTYDWALEFDGLVTKSLESRDFKSLTDIDRKDPLFIKAHPTPDHFMPIFYCLGMVDPSDELVFFNDGIDLGSISMKSFIFY